MNPAFEIIAKEALLFITNNIIVGLGSGSTAEYFISVLSKKCREENLNLCCVASSMKSAKLAQSMGLKIIELTKQVDVTFDGTDQIDTGGNLIKGRGGALFREKILAYNSKKMIVMATAKKEVSKLGKCALPLEIAIFGCDNTKRQLEKNGYQATFRKQENGQNFITDNGNYIIDITYDDFISDPYEEERKIKSIPGVIETGFFLKLASGKIIVQEDTLKSKVEFF